MDALASLARPPSKTSFSWKEALRELLRPQPLPRDWLKYALIFLAGSMAIIGIAIALGHVTRQQPDYYFGEKRLGTLASVAVLWGSAWICHKIHLQLKGTSFSGFWRGSSILFAFLGLDDLVRIHERVDRWIHALFGWNPDDPATDHIDGCIVALYPLLALWLCWRHRRQIAQLTLMIQIMAVAFLCFAGMVRLDYTSRSQVAEESLKLIAGVLILLGFLAVYLNPRKAEISRAESESPQPVGFD